MVVVILVPQAVIIYNKNMGGVDASKSQIAACKTSRNGLKKYYTKIFLYILDIIYMNFYTLTNEAVKS